MSLPHWSDFPQNQSFGWYSLLQEVMSKYCHHITYKRWCCPGTLILLKEVMLFRCSHLFTRGDVVQVLSPYYKRWCCPGALTLLQEVMLSRYSSSSRILSGKSMSAIPSSDMQVSSGFFRSKTRIRWGQGEYFANWASHDSCAFWEEQ